MLATTWIVTDQTQDHVEVDPDWELMTQIAGGDREAFAALVKRHQQRIVAICHRLLGDSDEALDASQDVFLKAFRQAGRFEPRARVSTWLHRIATNHCLNRLRRRAVLRWVPFVQEVAGREQVLEPLDEGPLADHQLGSKRELAAVRRAIELLPPNQRVVLVLIRFEGLSYRETAQTLGITEGAVESRLVRAMRRLQAARVAA